MKSLLTYTGTVLWAVFLLACQSTPTAPETAASDTAAAPAEDQVRMTAEQLSQAGIQLGQITPRPMAREVNCNGVIDVPPQGRAVISPPLAGFVQSLRVLPGDDVRAGQTLLTLRHPDYIRLQERYLEANSQLTFQEKEYERRRTLSENNALARKSFEQTESEYATLQARQASLAAQLQLLGIDPASVTPSTIRQTISIPAPIQGRVGAVHVSTGSYVDPQDPMLEIINKEHIHLELQVFEKDVLQLKKQQKLTFLVNGAPDHTFRGEIYLIGEVVDPMSKTVQVHAHPLTEEHALKPGMFVQATILTDADTVPTLPTDALVREQENYFVFTQEATGTFRKHPVQIGKRQGDYVTILNADQLPTDAPLVVQGAHYLEATRTAGEGE
ncbi:membrane fusion protein, cobalt-zinc-cadmium efflux system [Catalinimonas alkaloidigena]|uniref:Membrane fusion protein, cobalt-zinc-cadmium efflux system n=1 Tax=Catalinimonas alkaloidigena TaxID=1075417 RepID=A0A1G9DBQ2_9BACT|nr:efflux RND transporter periplasmic adaptor subunit [Catalinimonas alkaloidigena]SDK61253.1 membrane fusion protein, cobalt-zinc-cadmium efflux system [Catalinimonas alkaloidigena]